MGAIDYNRINGPQRRVVRETLLEVFANPAALDRFLDGSPNDYPMVSHYPGSYTDQVFELVRDLRARGHLGRMIGELHAAFPDSPHLADLDAQLRLVSDKAEVSSRAAELGGLEKITRSDRFKDLHLWAKALAALGEATCRLRLQDGAEVTYGTGVLVAPGRVLTNHHVVEAAIARPALVAALDCVFGYAETEAGLRPGAAARVGRILHNRPYSAADLAPGAGLPQASELDYALLDLAGPLPAAMPVSLGDLPPRPKDGDIVFILQHPRGQPLKFSVGTVEPSPTPLRLRYDANTLGGSSGGLVLTSDLRPVALHHAGDPEAVTRAEFNQGIPLDLIAADLRAAGLIP